MEQLNREILIEKFQELTELFRVNAELQVRKEEATDLKILEMDERLKTKNMCIGHLKAKLKHVESEHKWAAFRAESFERQAIHYKRVVDTTKLEKAACIKNIGLLKAELNKAISEGLESSTMCRANSALYMKVSIQLGDSEKRVEDLEKLVDQTHAYVDTLHDILDRHGIFEEALKEAVAIDELGLSKRPLKSRSGSEQASEEEEDSDAAEVESGDGQVAPADCSDGNVAAAAAANNTAEDDDQVASAECNDDQTADAVDDSQTMSSEVNAIAVEIEDEAVDCDDDSTKFLCGSCRHEWINAESPEPIFVVESENSTSMSNSDEDPFCHDGVQCLANRYAEVETPSSYEELTTPECEEGSNKEEVEDDHGNVFANEEEMKIYYEIYAPRRYEPPEEDESLPTFGRQLRHVMKPRGEEYRHTLPTLEEADEVESQASADSSDIACVDDEKELEEFLEAEALIAKDDESAPQDIADNRITDEDLKTYDEATDDALPTSRASSHELEDSGIQLDNTQDLCELDSSQLTSKTPLQFGKVTPEMVNKFHIIPHIIPEQIFCKVPGFICFSEFNFIQPDLVNCGQPQKDESDEQSETKVVESADITKKKTRRRSKKKLAPPPQKAAVKTAKPKARSSFSKILSFGAY